MGIRQILREWWSTDEPQRITFSETTPTPIDDMFRRMLHGGSRLDGTVTREEALSVPAVMQGRRVLCSIGTLPLVQYDVNTAVVPSGFLKQIDKNRTNVMVLTETIEDLVFYQVAWWRITQFYSDGYPQYAERISRDRIQEVEEKGTVKLYLDGKVIGWDQVIKFESPNPGLLIGMNGRVVRRALLLERMAALFANSPRRFAYFTPKSSVDWTGDEPETVEDKQNAAAELCEAWNTAAWERTTGFVPGWLDYKEITTLNPQELQLIQQQERAALDVANLLGVDPRDVGIAVNDETYQNGQEKRQDQVNTTKALMMRAITDRLSMPDVTKNGYVVAFDLDGYLQADPKTRMEVQTGYLAAGVITREEIRQEERMGPLPAELKDRPTPARVVSVVGKPKPEIEAA